MQCGNPETFRLSPSVPKFIFSLLVSHYLLGTNEVMVINHTDCGLMKAKKKCNRRIREGSGRSG